MRAQWVQNKLNTHQMLTHGNLSNEKRLLAIKVAIPSASNRPSPILTVDFFVSVKLRMAIIPAKRDLAIQTTEPLLSQALH